MALLDDEQAKKNLYTGLVIAAVLLAGFAYYHYVILKTHYLRNEEKKKALRVEVKELQDQLKEIQLVESQRDKIEEMRKVVAEASKRLPSTPDAVGFYNELIRILRITGVYATRVSPEKRRGQPMYTEIPYGVVCQCRYHEFGQFLNLIEENQNRFMRVGSFSIQNNDKRPSIHPINVRISTFMFNK